MRSTTPALATSERTSVRTGKLVWSFHTIPHPGEQGYENLAKGRMENAGGQCVDGMAVDSNRGVVYVPTASPTPTSYGANRKGSNLYATACWLSMHAQANCFVLPNVPSRHLGLRQCWHAMLTTVQHDGALIDVGRPGQQVGFVWFFIATQASRSGLLRNAQFRNPICQERRPANPAFPSKPAPSRGRGSRWMI